jgi:transposase
MANKTLSMDITRLIIQCLANKQSRRSIAQSINVSRKAISKIEAILNAASYTFQQALQLDELAFNNLFNTYKPRKNHLHDSRYDAALTHFKKYDTEVGRSVGLTLQLIWEEYVHELNKTSTYSYSQFCRHYSRYNKVQNTTMRIEHTPGLYLQLDFTGKHLFYTDTDTGEIIACEVLVATLPYSSMFWAVALPSTRQEDFIKGIQWVFRKIGYLPKILKIDNLKSGVIKSEKYEPEFNKLLIQMCNHFGVGIEATRPRKPKDKPSVEMSVNLAYMKAFAKMRNTIYTNANNLNLDLSKYINEFCKENFQKKLGTRHELFEKEKPFLNPITVGKFELKKHKLATVQKDCTVMLGEDKHYYTVPHTYVGRKAEIIYSSTLVQIFFEGNLIASHAREQGHYTTTINMDHYAPNNQSYLKKLKYDGEKYKSLASQIGPATEQYIQMLLTNYAFEEMAYKSCDGLLRLKTQFGTEALEQACKAFSGHNTFSYKPIKNYLVNNKNRNGSGQETSPSAHNTNTPSNHNNLRGPQQYS